jgi:hypothetical protein
MPLKNCPRLNYTNIIITSAVAILCIIGLMTLTASIVNTSTIAYALKVTLICASGTGFSLLSIFTINQTKIHLTKEYKDHKKEYFKRQSHNITETK